jgi:hypothetical protein
MTKSTIAKLVFSVAVLVGSDLINSVDREWPAVREHRRVDRGGSRAGTARGMKVGGWVTG